MGFKRENKWNPEKESTEHAVNRLTQNLGVIAHKLYFSHQPGDENFINTILDTIAFMRWLYEQQKEE